MPLAARVDNLARQVLYRIPGTKYPAAFYRSNCSACGGFPFPPIPLFLTHSFMPGPFCIPFSLSPFTYAFSVFCSCLMVLLCCSLFLPIDKQTVNNPLSLLDCPSIPSWPFPSVLIGRWPKSGIPGAFVPTIGYLSSS